MAKRRRSKRKKNPVYSEAVFEIANSFIDKLDAVANEGHKAAKKIQMKTGNVPIATEIMRAADSLGDISEDLEDALNDE